MSTLIKEFFNVQGGKRCILEHHCFADAILFPITSCFLSIDSLIGPIHRHETHDVIRFFHCIDMKRNPMQLSCPCISRPHLLVGKMTLDVLHMDVFWPVSSFLDQCARVYTFFCSSTIPFNTQKPLSRIIIIPKLKIGNNKQSNNPTVAPRSSNCCCPRSRGQSLPSTISIPHIIPLKQQHTI